MRELAEMTLKNIAIAVIILIVLANLIALNALPDAIVGLNLLAIVAVLIAIGYFFLVIWSIDLGNNF